MQRGVEKNTGQQVPARELVDEGQLCWGEGEAEAGKMEENWEDPGIPSGK